MFKASEVASNVVDMFDMNMVAAEGVVISHFLKRLSMMASKVLYADGDEHYFASAFSRKYIYFDNAMAGDRA